MNRQEITHKELINVLDYNSLTGLLYWKAINSIKTKIAGTKRNDGYIQIGINNTLYLAHRLAWFHYYGYMPENTIDHIDNLPEHRHHNWISNLREASNQCQMRNQGLRKDNTSSVKGVCWYKTYDKWQSQIRLNNKVKFLGRYKDFDNAVCARLAGEQCLNWSGCDSESPAYLYVKRSIQN